MSRFVLRAVAKVVADLVGDAELRSEGRERGELIVAGSGDERAQRRSQGEQRSRLLPDDVEVVVLAEHASTRIEFFELSEAAQLGALAQCLDRTGEDRGRYRHPRLAHRVEGRD